MKTKNFGRKFTAFLAAVVITAGAITTGTVLLLRNNNKTPEKPASALTLNDLIKNVADLQNDPATAHLFQSSIWVAPYEHYIEFGEYPQTHLANATLINKLNTTGIKTGRQYLVNSNPTSNSSNAESVLATWTATLLDEYALDGLKYVKMATPKPYSTATHTLSTGVNFNTINTAIWFKVEPLRWYVTNYDEVDAGTAAAIKLLAVNNIIAGIPFHNFSTSPSPYGYATYEDSGIRAFLNGYTDTIFNTASPSMTIPADKGFLQSAFNKTARDLINPVTIENNTDASFNDVNDRDTTDKIYLPSYNDMLTAPFPTSSSDSYTNRFAYPTDFAWANFASNLTGPWLRSANSAMYTYCIGNTGYTSAYNPARAEAGIRPMMEISVAGLADIADVRALTREQLTYNYDMNGGGGAWAGGIKTICNPVTLPTAAQATAAGIARAGYILSGWGVNDPENATFDLSGAAFMLTCNTTIYAIWKLDEYEISYDLGTGGAWASGYTTAPVKYNTIDGAVLPTRDKVVRAGYTFMCWHEGSISGPVVTAIQPNTTAGNKKYFAEWGHTDADYTNAITARDNTIAEKQAAIEAKDETIKEKEDIIETRDATITEKEGMIEQLNIAKTKLESDLKQLEDEYDELQDDYDKDELEISEKAAEITQLKEDIAQLGIDLVSAENDLTEYMDAHAGDYDRGYADYVKENSLVVWKVLLDDESIGGPLTVYGVYDKVTLSYSGIINDITKTNSNDPSYEPVVIPTVRSKQYEYSFVGWSLTPQRSATPNAFADLPKSRPATDMIYYAQYEQTERIYDIKWIIPVITGGQLNYNISPEQEEITTLKYGTVITAIPEAPALLQGDGANYIFAGWSTTPGGTKITNFGSVTGERTFYAKYIPQPTV